MSKGTCFSDVNGERSQVLLGTTALHDTGDNGRAGYDLTQFPRAGLAQKGKVGLTKHFLVDSDQV